MIKDTDSGKRVLADTSAPALPGQDSSPRDDLSAVGGAAGAGRAWPETFRALRHRNFRLFWFGQILALSGYWLNFAARQWLIYRLTGSAFALGWVSFVALLPVLPVSLVAGAVVDRVPKRKLIVITQVGLMINVLIMAAITWAGIVQIWHLVVLQLTFGLLGAIDMPARQAFVVEMVGKDDLMNAIALNSAVFNAARAIGPAVGGLLIATLGEGGSFFVSGITYLAVIGGLLLMRLDDRPAETGGASLRANLVEGVRYTLGHRALLGLMSLMAVVGLFGMSHINLMPVFAQDVLQVGAEQYGLLLAAVGLGAVIGALAVARLKEGRRGRWLLVGSLTLAVALILFAVARQIALLWVLLVIAGAAFIAVQAVSNTLVQILAPDRLRGRVLSLYSLLFIGSQQAGTLGAGAAADLVNAPFVVIVGAIITAGYALLLFALLPAVRRLE